MIYIVYLLLLVVLLALERNNKSNNNIYRWIIPLVYIILIGFRGANVGVDTAVYYDHYYTFGEFGCDFIEKGFDFLNQFCYHRGWSHVPFFCICAAIPIFCVSFSIRDVLTRREYTVFMLLFCTTTFVSFSNGMRQNIACGIIFACIMFAQYSQVKNKHKIIVYVVGFLIGSLFHVSVLFVLPIYLLKYIKLPNSVYVILFLASFLFIYFNVADYLIAKFPVFALGEKDYSNYFYDDLTHESASPLGFIISSLKYWLVLIMMIRINSFKEYPLLSNLVFMLFVLSNLGFNVPMVGRINMYFSFFYILLVAKILSRYFSGYLRKDQVRILSLIFITIVLAVYPYISDSGGMRDYNFFWETPNYQKFINI